MKPNICILITDGINCDSELYYAFKLAGGKPILVHINQLLQKKQSLNNFQILALPGGFAYGDDILSAKILANELLYKLGKEIDEFIKKKCLIIGICNGFQTLVRMGLLPWKMQPAEDVSLILNDSGKFECRWVKLRIEKSNCIFTQGLEGRIFEMPTAHGEGKFIVKNNKVKDMLEESGQIVAYYTDESANKTQEYPKNPNGSCSAIAGIVNTTGRIFGIMPHPERNILPYHHPNWRRVKVISCLPFFKNAVDYFIYNG